MHEPQSVNKARMSNWKILFTVSPSAWKEDEDPKEFLTKYLKKVIGLEL